MPLSGSPIFLSQESVSVYSADVFLPAIQFSGVVLPAPFGPSRPNSSPGRTSSVTPSRATTGRAGWVLRRPPHAEGADEIQGFDGRGRHG